MSTAHMDKGAAVAEDARPLLLDLFSGGGGAARGYQLAGFHVTGVDVVPQPRYAGDAFMQADALTVPLDGFDAVHASPPCQAYTPLNARWGHRHTLRLVAQVRDRLARSGLPYVIENVPGSDVRRQLLLCGGMFGLRVYRHRYFESNVLLPCLPHPRHARRAATRERRAAWARGGHVSITGDVGVYLGKEAMGIDWMRGDELCQAIPPAYTAYIGHYLSRAVLGPEQEDQP